MRILGTKDSRRKAGILRQRGLTLIETATVLGVAAVAMTYFSNLMADNSEQVRAKGVAEKIVEVQEAARDYLKVHNAALMTAAAGGPITIPVGKTAPGQEPPGGPSGHPELPSLQGGGFLTSNFLDKNGYDQSHALIVKRNSITRPDGSVEYKLDAIVTTFGGQTIPDRQLQRIATFVGASGGYVPKTTLKAADDDMIVGVQGGWRTGTGDWGTAGSRPAEGSVVSTLAYEGGTIVNDYLYRNNIGIPEANRMNVDIDMANNKLRNTKAITGEVNAATGRATVTFENNTDGGGNRPTDVDVLNGSVTAGVDVWAKQDVKADRDVDATRNVIGQTFVDKDDASYVVDPDGASRVNNVQANDVRTASLSLDTLIYSPNYEAGLGGRGIARGHQIRLGDLLPKFVLQEGWIARHDETVQKPTCGNNGVARIVLSPIEDSMAFDVALDVEYREALKSVSTGSPSSPSGPGPGGTVPAGNLSDGLVFESDIYVYDVRSNGKKTKVARQIRAVDNNPGANGPGTTWTVQVNGTDRASGYPAVLHAATYCQYP